MESTHIIDCFIKFSKRVNANSNDAEEIFHDRQPVSAVSVRCTISRCRVRRRLSSKGSARGSVGFHIYTWPVSHQINTPRVLDGNASTRNALAQRSPVKVMEWRAGKKAQRFENLIWRMFTDGSEGFNESKQEGMTRTTESCWCQDSI